ncbi:MAG: uroporphyrinogen decarboxylase family protein [Armatimonadota bacterium]
MTSRQRVQAALNHREPDRVPVDMGSSFVTGIAATTYARLKRSLGLNGAPPKVNDLLQMLAEVELSVLEKLDLDVIALFPRGRFFGIPAENWKPWTTFDGTEVLVPGGFQYRVDTDGSLLLSPGGDTSKPPSGRMPKDGYYFDIIVRQQQLDWDHLDPADFAEQFTRYSDDELERLAATADSLYRNTSYSILGSFGGGALGDMPFVLGSELDNPKGIRSYDDFLVAHITHPEYIRGIFALQTERCLENLELYRQAVGDRIDAIFISGTDFGTQRGPFTSPDIYRDLYKPFHKRINDWVHTHTKWKTFFHSCGSIYRLIPDLIEAGVDILNPVQCSAAEMDPARLKREFGDKLVFWGGGVDTQRTLPFGTPDEVRREVAERIRIFAPGGGFIFNTIHNIQAKTPIQNLLAMFESAHDAGRYPVGT